ncbi:MAG TPA: DUF4280 domain-containing protein [Bacillota bacterium]
MNQNYVVEGAKLECSFGDTPSNLRIPFQRYSLIDCKKIAVINDYHPNLNIMPFGMCHSRSNPEVARATAANHGRLTPQPCKPMTTSPWMRGKNDVTVDDVPCLLKVSTLRCQWCGVIQVSADGQPE